MSRWMYLLVFFIENRLMWVSGLYINTFAIRAQGKLQRLTVMMNKRRDSFFSSDCLAHSSSVYFLDAPGPFFVFGIIKNASDIHIICVPLFAISC